MSVYRDDPYKNFNFLVDLGTGDAHGPDAGFSEVVLPTLAVDVIEYRVGNDKENAVRKLTGLRRVGNVTLKRGITGSLSLHQWFRDTANGAPNTVRDVTITLLDEARNPVFAWRLRRARIVKIEGPTLKATGNEVAIESIELAVEGVDVE